ncbi:MAG TPA: RNA methyltransferase [Nitrososphaerales archaeon]|nr:RNA methyltransferase [Nitrososphaerales archaeon]
MPTERLDVELARFLALALVEPEYSMNVGYAARLAANFGLTKLYIVGGDKTRKLDKSIAEKFASHGNHLISSSKTVKSLEHLREQFRFLVGTTAIQGRRKSNLTRKTLDVTECAKRVARLTDLDGSNQICLVMGRDTTGLTNEELRLCDFVLSIKTDSNYNTLNVSHAAAIILFEFAKALKHERDVMSGERKSTVSYRKEKDLVIRLFAELALLSDFHGFKRGKLNEALSRLLSRSDPTLRELYLLMGLASKASSRIRLLSGRKESQIESC